MIYLTGDTHRDFRLVGAFCDTVQSTPDDVLVILGDAGINYYGDDRDYKLKHLLTDLPITLFCVHGNHEQRPESLGYIETEWHGGMVYAEPEFPLLLFAKAGEIYDLVGDRCIAIGGAYSVDKPLRIAEGWGWWPDEQPSDEIKRRVGQQLTAEGNVIDIVLSHTCPFKYIPREVFLSGIDQSTVDTSTEYWLDTIEDRLTYNRWYCGHYHTEKTVDKMRFMFHDFLELR